MNDRWEKNTDPLPSRVRRKRRENKNVCEKVGVHATVLGHFTSAYHSHVLNVFHVSLRARYPFFLFFYPSTNKPSVRSHAWSLLFILISLPPRLNRYERVCRFVFRYVFHKKNPLAGVPVARFPRTRRRSGTAGTERARGRVTAGTVQAISLR